MTLRSACAVILLAGLAGMAGCGRDDSGSEKAATDWVDALSESDWDRACRSLFRPPRNCQADLAAQYDGRKLSLLPAGAYQSGDVVTDNKTRFALEATRERRETLTFFVVRKVDGGWRIDPRVAVQSRAAPGPARGPRSRGGEESNLPSPGLAGPPRFQDRIRRQAGAAPGGS